MNREIKAGLVWAGSALALALGAVGARKLGYIDGDMVTRLVIGFNGLMIVWYGNRIPKTFTRSAQARRAQRVAAWSQVLSGLVYTGLFLFAPIRVAALAGAGAVLAGFAVTILYAVSLHARARRA